MIDKKQARLRRGRATRARQKVLRMHRLTVYRSNTHIYAQIIDPSGGQVVASASSLEKDLREELRNGGNVDASRIIGKRIAEKAMAAGIGKVAFDRSGYRYHGRVRALAEAARESGLQF